MQRVREQVMERKRMAAHQKSLQEIVVEESVPNIAYVAALQYHAIGRMPPPILCITQLRITR